MVTDYIQNKILYTYITYVQGTYCSDKIRPPDLGHLSALMTHSGIGSYRCRLREMLCPICAVAAFPPSLNALY
jgi:hypothetical protein